MDPQPLPVLVQGRDLEVRIGLQVVLDHATLAIHAGERVGLLGRNGCGKSTLMRLLAGVDAPDRGELQRRRDLRIGYLPQQSTLDLDASVGDNIFAGVRDVLDLIRRFEAAPHDSHESHTLEHRIQALGGWDLDVRRAKLMEHLEAPPLDRLAGTLSGGERRRTALCRALIGQPDLLLLDEPTNDLDVETLGSLENALEKFPGCAVVISHDRWFLDRTCTHILAWEGDASNEAKWFWFEGNFDSYEKNKLERLGAEAARPHRATYRKLNRD